MEERDVTGLRGEGQQRPHQSQEREQAGDHGMSSGTALTGECGGSEGDSGRRGAHVSCRRPE
ncbi:hypothetical protein E1211_11335 [Micromonospora sp. 15K316]|uniref:hypothetical protein n=1 Tax=Micromonospora sp. 15K316 TaxID=2530376 RepID=UPI001042F101|nr:hypothetical protein [Micromonospora sp. 15K316]TDC37110.1 hypothetical protein E1211_11335 [Micromonospora sp. 15K316]